MNSGIYQLTFANGDTYVGKSLDLERRWQQHADKLSKGTAAKNMLEAYYNSDHEYPTAQILLECHPDVLDEYENLFINGLLPTLNTQRPKPRTPVEREALVRHAEAGLAVCGVPVIIIALENTTDERDRALEEVKELQEIVDAWDDKTMLELQKSEKYMEVVEDRDNLDHQLQELQQWQFRVETATWWQRLWRTW